MTGIADRLLTILGVRKLKLCSAKAKAFMVSTVFVAFSGVMAARHSIRSLKHHGGRRFEILPLQASAAFTDQQQESTRRQIQKPDEGT